MKSVHNGIRLIDDKTPFHVKEAYKIHQPVFAGAGGGADQPVDH